MEEGLLVKTLPSPSTPDACHAALTALALAALGVRDCFNGYDIQRLDVPLDEACRVLGCVARWELLNVTLPVEEVLNQRYFTPAELEAWRIPTEPGSGPDVFLAEASMDGVPGPGGPGASADSAASCPEAVFARTSYTLREGGDLLPVALPRVPPKDFLLAFVRDMVACVEACIPPQRFPTDAARLEAVSGSPPKDAVLQDEQYQQARKEGRALLKDLEQPPWHPCREVAWRTIVDLWGAVAVVAERAGVPRRRRKVHWSVLVSDALSFQSNWDFEDPIPMSRHVLTNAPLPLYTSYGAPKTPPRLVLRLAPLPGPDHAGLAALTRLRGVVAYTPKALDLGPAGRAFWELLQERLAGLRQAVLDLAAAWSRLPTGQHPSGCRHCTICLDAAAVVPLDCWRPYAECVGLAQPPLPPASHLATGRALSWASLRTYLLHAMSMAPSPYAVSRIEGMPGPRSSWSLSFLEECQAEFPEEIVEAAGRGRRQDDDPNWPWSLFAWLARQPHTKDRFQKLNQAWKARWKDEYPAAVQRALAAWARPLVAAVPEPLEAKESGIQESKDEASGVQGSNSQESNGQQSDDQESDDDDTAEAAASAPSPRFCGPFRPWLPVWQQVTPSFAPCMYCGRNEPGAQNESESGCSGYGNRMVCAVDEDSGRLLSRRLWGYGQLDWDSAEPRADNADLTFLPATGVLCDLCLDVLAESGHMVSPEHQGSRLPPLLDWARLPPAGTPTLRPTEAACRRPGTHSCVRCHVGPAFPFARAPRELIRAIAGQGQVSGRESAQLRALFPQPTCFPSHRAIAKEIAGALSARRRRHLASAGKEARALAQSTEDKLSSAASWVQQEAATDGILAALAAQGDATAAAAAFPRREEERRITQEVLAYVEQHGMLPLCGRAAPPDACTAGIPAELLASWKAANAATFHAVAVARRLAKDPFLMIRRFLLRSRNAAQTA